MEVEGHLQVIDGGMVAVVVVAAAVEEVVAVVLVGEDLVSLAILNFEVFLFRDSLFYFRFHLECLPI